MIFSVVTVIIPDSWLSVIVVLNPGLFLILMSDFLTPLSISSSFAIFVTISIACFLSNSSGKFSRSSAIIWSPLKPCSDFSKIKASWLVNLL